MLNSVFRNAHLFLYVGVGLILLALVSSFATTKISIMDSGFTRYVDAPTGFVIFAPIIGSYALTSLTLGITEFQMSKKETLIFFFPLFIPIYVWSSLIMQMAIRQLIADPWWLHLSILLIPGITVSAVGVLSFTKKEYVNIVLKQQWLRITAFTAIITLPLVYVIVLWLSSPA